MFTIIDVQTDFKMLVFQLLFSREVSRYSYCSEEDYLQVHQPESSSVAHPILGHVACSVLIHVNCKLPSHVCNYHIRHELVEVDAMSLHAVSSQCI